MSTIASHTYKYRGLTRSLTRADDSQTNSMLFFQQVICRLHNHCRWNRFTITIAKKDVTSWRDSFKHVHMISGKSFLIKPKIAHGRLFHEQEASNWGALLIPIIQLSPTSQIVQLFVIHSQLIASIGLSVYRSSRYQSSATISISWTPTVLQSFRHNHSHIYTYGKQHK